MKNFLFTTLLSFLSIAVISQIDTTTLEFDEVRELFELNSTQSGEGYPWISNDGLRIYYTTRTDQYFVNVVAKRDDIDDLFSDPIELITNLDSTNNFSPWLTNDELDIFFVSAVPGNLGSTNLYHASRTDINEDFDEPVKVSLNSGNGQFRSSPSFTEDLEDLLLFTAYDSDMDTVFHFKKSDDGSYDQVDFISVPQLYVGGPGKLSKNGLKYYFSINIFAAFSKKIYVAEREDLDSKFDKLYFIDNPLINMDGTTSIQPHIAKDQRFMVFTRSDGLSWGANDLYIAVNEFPVSVLEYEAEDKIAVVVSPNPASDFIKFELENHRYVDQSFSLVIYTALGRLIDEVTFDNQNTNVYLSTADYSSGMYFFQIKSEKGDFTSGNFMISK